jgi:hypothetical protein
MGFLSASSVRWLSRATRNRIKIEGGLPLARPTEEGFASLSTSTRIKKIILDNIHEAVNGRLNGEVIFQLDFQRRMDRLASYSEELAMLLTAIIVGKEHAETITIKTPADWWEMVKERFLPDFWLAYYPVRHKEQVIPVRVFRVCPHLKPAATSRHTAFAVAEEGADKVVVDYREFMAFRDWQDKGRPLFEQPKSYQWMETANGILIPVEHPTIMQRLVQFVRRNLLSPNAKL